MRTLLIFIWLSSNLFAQSNFYWRPTATNVRQVDAHDLAGLTIIPGKKIIFTQNGRALTLTVGTDVTAAEVAAECASMLDATNRDDGILGPTTDETRNAGGEEIPEFFEIDAYASGTSVFIESKYPGQPFTITVTEDCTGVITSTTPTPATGENHVDNVANWLKDDGTRLALPDDPDTMVFDAPAPSALYGLGVFQTGNREADFTRTTDFDGNIGLSIRHFVAAKNVYYFEYRATHLELDGSAVIYFKTGITPVNKATVTKLDVDGETGLMVQLEDTGTIGSEPSVYIKGGTAAELFFLKGYAYIDNPQEKPTTAGVYTQINVGTGEGTVNTCKLILGPTVHSNNASGTIEQVNGEIRCFPSLNGGGADRYTVTTNGLFRYLGGNTHSITIGNAGVFSWEGGGGDVNANIVIEKGGTFKLSNAQLPIVWTSDIDMYAGSTLDLRTYGDVPFLGGLGANINIIGCQERDVTILEP